MNAEHGRWVVQRHECRDGGPEVAAVRAVALVSQAAHQAVPQPRRIAACHSRPGRPIRESVARQRGNHHVKTGPVNAMRGRVRQPGHERQELSEATRPAICQDQRGSAAAAGPFVHKMHPDTIDPGPEVTEPVQPAFLRAPVEAVRPVRQQVPQVTEVRALLPRRTWPRPRPPRVSDPRTQVGEDLVAHPDTELLRPEGCHPASLARYRHLERPWLTAGEPLAQTALSSPTRHRQTHRSKANRGAP